VLVSVIFVQCLSCLFLSLVSSGFVVSNPLAFPLVPKPYGAFCRELFDSSYVIPYAGWAVAFGWYFRAPGSLCVGVILECSCGLTAHAPCGTLHSHTPTHTPTRARAHTHTHTHPPTHPHKHTHPHTHTHTPTPTHPHTHPHTHTHTHTPTHIHTHTHTQTHTLTHMNTYTEEKTCVVFFQYE
jgi:hypothetical protein